MDDFYFSSVRRPYYKEISSLQTMLLRVVTLNFDRYMHEFRSPESVIPKYFFEFLQKKYSQELLVNLLDYGILKQDYLDFVINIHLREITLKSVPSQCKMLTIRQKIVEIGKGLVGFSLMGAFNFHYLQPVLSCLPNIRKLQLEYSNCNDENVKVIANNCPHLIDLNLYASTVTDEGMKYLCFPDKHKLCLESLTVSRTQVKDHGVLVVLKNMPFMEILTYENLARVISHAVANYELPENKNLNLTFVEVHIAKSELEAVSRLCPNIEHLFVKHITSHDQLLNCCAFKKLKDVCLAYESGKKPNLCIDDFLETCGSGINNLSLESFIMSVGLLVKSCPRLQVLELYDPAFEEVSSGAISKLRFENLTHFKIYGCSLLTTEEVKSASFIVESSPKLRSLSLQCCFIGPQMEDVILNCPGPLLQLDFTESLVNVNFLQEVILRHRALQYLIIENSGLHNTDYQKLFDLVEHIKHPLNMLWC